LSIKTFKKSKFSISVSNVYEDRGFTLIEVLAAVTVFVLLIGTTISLFIFYINIFQSDIDRLDLQQNVRIATDFLIRELRYADDLQMISNTEICYRLPEDTNTYAIKKKNKEIVILSNKNENKIAYNINFLHFNWDEQRKILSFEIQGKGDNNKYTYATRSAVCLQNLHERR